VGQRSSAHSAAQSVLAQASAGRALYDLSAVRTAQRAQATWLRDARGGTEGAAGSGRPRCSRCEDRQRRRGSASCGLAVGRTSLRRCRAEVTPPSSSLKAGSWRIGSRSESPSRNGWVRRKLPVSEPEPERTPAANQATGQERRQRARGSRAAASGIARRAELTHRASVRRLNSGGGSPIVTLSTKRAARTTWRHS
jgi:hypothetical protein